MSRARQLLSESAYRLFEAMPVGDKAHALAVLDRLEKQGVESPDLLRAALLHDVGKATAGLNLAHRSLAVLLERIDPDLLESLADRDAGSARRPFHAYLHHAELGARLCREAGCSPRVCALVRYHERRLPGVPEDPGMLDQLSALRRADDDS